MAPGRPSQYGDRMENWVTQDAFYDLTYLIARLRADTGTGIDRIDLAYARYFLEQRGSTGVHYGRNAPHLMSPAHARGYIRAARDVWRTGTLSPATSALRHWLDRGATDNTERPHFAKSRTNRAAWSRRLLSWKGHVVRTPGLQIPEGAIYINVGYHRMEALRYFQWLEARPDVRAVFMIHDLLPLDFPEYFAPGESEKFSVRLNTALRYGRAFIVSTETVKRRLEQEIERRRARRRLIAALPFPSPLADSRGADLATPSRPYFLVIGTIEPRKNHLLLLNVWRRLAAQRPDAPRLVVVGVRGWENEQVVDMLERSESVRANVLEASNLSSPDLVALIRGARALLAPSFDEGYGLPIVEALSLGTPVVASDLPFARETSQGAARFLSPLNGDIWEEEILRLTDDAGYFAEAKRIAATFDPPNWTNYFARLDDFLAEI